MKGFCCYSNNYLNIYSLILLVMY